MIRDVVRWQPPQEWGVLCIDAWHREGTNDAFYLRALEHLSKFNVQIVINCCTDLAINYQDKSVYNTLNQYLWSASGIIEEQKTRVLSNLIHCAGHQQTSKVLQDQLFDYRTVHLSDRFTFLEHCHKFCPTVKHWIVLGSAWGYCLHTGPLGIDKLVDITEMHYNIFPDWSVQTESYAPPSLQQLHDDFYVWAPIPDNGYTLITRAQNHKWFDQK